MIDDVIKIFYKWLQTKPVKLDGIKVVPILTDDLHIDFECNVYEDVSYYDWAVSLAIELHFERFLKLSGMLERDILNEGVSRFNTILDKEIHLSSKDLSKIDEACENIKRIVFTPSHNLFTADVNVDFVTLDPSDDGIAIVLVVEFLRPKINGVSTSNPDELKPLVKPKFTFHNELEDFEFQFLNSVTNVIWNGPKSIFNQDTMFVYPKVNYRYKGKFVWGFED
jgi:hypothetical protein